VYDTFVLTESETSCWYQQLINGSIAFPFLQKHLLHPDYLIIIFSTYYLKNYANELQEFTCVKFCMPSRRIYLLTHFPNNIVISITSGFIELTHEGE